MTGESFNIRNLGRWVRGQGTSSAGRIHSGKAKKTSNGQTDFYRCSLAPGLRVPLGDVGVVRDVKEGDTLVSEPFEDRHLGIRGLQVYTERDLSHPIRTVCLTVGGRPIRPIVISATPRERFGFQLACWLADETGVFPPPRELEIEPSDRLVLPHYSRPRVHFLESAEAEEYYDGSPRIANMVALSHLSHLSRPNNEFHLPAVRKAGNKFLTDPVHLLFRAIPRPADIVEKALRSMTLRPEISNGVKCLSVLGRTADGEELLLAIFEAITGGKTYPLYRPVTLTDWLRGRSKKPNCYSFLPAHKCRNGKGLQIRISKSVEWERQDILTGYIPTGKRILEHDGRQYVLVGQNVNTANEKEITMHGLREGGFDEEGLGFSPFQRVIKGKDAPNGGKIVRMEGKNIQEAMAANRQYEEFFRGEKDAKDLPVVTRRITSKGYVFFFRRMIYLGTAAKGLNSAQIVPFEEGDSRGIQVWGMENGARVGDHPIKTLFAADHRNAIVY